MKKTIEILEKIKNSCFESKQRNGTIAYAVGGEESTQTNYKQALTTAIETLKRIDVEKIKAIIGYVGSEHDQEITAQVICDYLQGIQ